MAGEEVVERHRVVLAARDLRQADYNTVVTCGIHPDAFHLVGPLQFCCDRRYLHMLPHGAPCTVDFGGYSFDDGKKNTIKTIVFIPLGSVGADMTNQNSACTV